MTHQDAENARPRGIQWYVGKCWRTHSDGYRQRRLLVVTPWSIRSYPIGPKLHIDGPEESS